MLLSMLLAIVAMALQAIANDPSTKNLRASPPSGFVTKTIRTASIYRPTINDPSSDQTVHDALFAFRKARAVLFSQLSAVGSMPACMNEDGQYTCTSSSGNTGSAYSVTASSSDSTSGNAGTAVDTSSILSLTTSQTSRAAVSSSMALSSDSTPPTFTTSSLTSYQGQDSSSVDPTSATVVVSISPTEASNGHSSTSSTSPNNPYCSKASTSDYSEFAMPTSTTNALSVLSSADTTSSLSTVLVEIATTSSSTTLSATVCILNDPTATNGCQILSSTAGAMSSSAVPVPVDGGTTTGWSLLSLTSIASSSSMSIITGPTWNPPLTTITVAPPSSSTLTPASTSSSLSCPSGDVTTTGICQQAPVLQTEGETKL